MGVFVQKNTPILEENPPTLINHNFLTTEPILKVKDVLESYESESFISGI